MKIIHCADLHLDSKLNTHLTKEQARERNSEMLRTFDRMVEYGRKNGVSVIMIAGDVFDTRNVSVKTRNTIRDIIRKASDMDFLYLKGNHDMDSFLSHLDEIPENLCLFGSQWISYNYDKISITGIELDADNSLTAYNSLVLDHDRYNIVMLHGQMTEYGSRDKAEIISLEDLRNKNIDYLALGHVHGYQMERLDNRGVWCYSGCLEGRGFDECGPKGFVLLDVDPVTRTATAEFVPIAYRTLYALPVDITGAQSTPEAAERIEKAIAESGYASTSMVKIVLCGEVDVECELNTEYLAEQFSEYFYYLKVKDETKIRINYMDYENDISLKGEFVRMVSASELSEEEKSRIIRAGIQVLQGEDISL